MKKILDGGAFAKNSGLEPREFHFAVLGIRGKSAAEF